MFKFIFAFALLASTQSLAADAKYCTRLQDWASVIQSAGLQENRLSFANDGGLANGGVCWWHSLFQRSALYLAAFRPDLSKPTAAEATDVIAKLVKQDEVVEIPGYADLFSFSQDWHPEIESALEKWQVTDGFVRQAWIGNIDKKTWTSPATLRATMDSIEREVLSYQRIPWVMIKLPGIEAHAYLVIGFKHEETGDELTVIDSNDPLASDTVWYSFGDQSVSTPYGNVTLWLGHSEFYDHIQTIVGNYCSK